MFNVEQQIAQEGCIAEATAQIAVHVADGYEIHLFQDGFVPNKNSVAADFAGHEADFTGYAAKSIGGAGVLFVGPFIDDGGNVVYSTPQVTWIATDAVNPNSIKGYWVENTAGKVLEYCLYPQLVDMSYALAAHKLTVFEQPRAQGYAVCDD